MKRITALIILIAGLLFVSSASAFTGPWDRAHQPATITNPAVTVFRPAGSTLDYYNGTGDGASVEITLTWGTYGTAAACWSWTDNESNPPDPPFSVTISTPTRSVTEPFWYGGIADDQRSCSWSSDQFTLPTDKSSVVPMLYTVSGPTGIVAQDMFTWRFERQGGNWVIDQSTSPDSFFNVCIKDGYDIRSHNGGILYCVVPMDDSRASFTHGWPTPPKPQLPQMTGQAARHYSIVALQHRFKGLFYLGGFKSKCNKRISRTRVRCSVSWYQGDWQFSGRTDAWYSWHGKQVAWNYSYDITRVDDYCHSVEHHSLKRCSKHYHVS